MPTPYIPLLVPVLGVLKPAHFRVREASYPYCVQERRANMPMEKIIPDRVDFRIRLPAEVDRALRTRAAERWMDRNTYIRELIRRDLLRSDTDETRAEKLWS
jgi:hypothetical protein